MSSAVVFAFAVADGLTPVVGAAPFDVLSRQLPRTLVAQLNGGSDRGVKFFPFLGPVDGERTFLRLRQPMEPAAMLQVHQQGDVELLIDGCLFQDRLVWRAIDGKTGAVRMSIELPFEPTDPLAVLPRLGFEIVGLLGWTGQTAPVVALSGEALGWFLVLQDEMLRLEARLVASSPDPLRAARMCVEQAGADPVVQQLVADVLALVLRRGQHREAAAAISGALAAHVEAADQLDRIAGLIQAAGDERAAAAVAVRAALASPTDTQRAERAVALAFRVQDHDAIQAIVTAARAAGALTPKLLAQLAASHDRRGDVAQRAELLAELLQFERLPVPVTRLVVSFLIEDERAAEARTRIDEALQQSPDQPMLHYERARASLLLDDAAQASLSLQRAIDLGLPEGAESQARRLLRMASVPGLWRGTQQVEQRLAVGDLRAAHDGARQLVRDVGPVAEAWLLLGIVEQKLGRNSRAERVLLRAIRCHADCAEAHNRVGVLLLQRGRIEDGSRHLQQAHDLSPDDTSTLLHLAQARALGGQLDVAEQHLEQAHRLGADPQLVQAVRAEIRAA